MGLPTDLARYFSVVIRFNELRKAGKEIPNPFPPRSLGDFFRDTDYDYNLIWEAASICRRLVNAGVLTAAGNSQESPPLSECYLSNTIKAELHSSPIFEFLAYGFLAVHHYFNSAVCPLIVEKANGDPDIGTCFVLANRMLVTARHCVENMSNISIKDWSPQVSSLRAIHVFNNAKVDLALLQFEKDPLPHAPGFQLGQPNILDPVMSMGYPQIQGFDAPLIAETSQIASILKSSVGIVVGQSISYLDSQDYLLLSARVKGGNSGGPVIGNQGAVLGVVTHLPAEDYGRPDLLGYAAALPSMLINQLIESATNNSDDVTTIDFQHTDNGFSTRYGPIS